MVKRRIGAVIARLRGREEGQSLVEFALVAPIFLLLVFGVVEFGMAWNAKQALADAVRSGCRVAVLARPSITRDTVSLRINTNLRAAGLDTASAIKTITGFKGGTDTPAVCTITYPYQLRILKPFMGWTGTRGAFPMTESVTFRNE